MSSGRSSVSSRRSSVSSRRSSVSSRRSSVSSRRFSRRSSVRPVRLSERSSVKSSTKHIKFEELNKLEIPVTLGEFAVKSKAWSITASEMLNNTTISYVPTGVDHLENSHNANVIVGTKKSITTDVFTTLKNENVILDFESPISRDNFSFTAITAPPADKSVAGIIMSTPAKLIGSIDTVGGWQKFTVITTMTGALSKFLAKLETLGEVQVLAYQSLMVPSPVLINASPDLTSNTRTSTSYNAFRVVREAYRSGYYDDKKPTWNQLVKLMTDKGIINSSSTLTNMMKRGQHLAIEGYLGNPAIIEILKEESKIKTENTFDMFSTPA